MTSQLQDFDLSGDSFHIDIFYNAVLFEDFDSNLLTGQIVSSKLNLSEGAFSDGLSNLVMADRSSLLLTFTIASWLGMVPVFVCVFAALLLRRPVLILDVLAILQTKLSLLARSGDELLLINLRGVETGSTNQC